MWMIKTKIEVWKLNVLSPVYSILLLLCTGFVTGSSMNISSAMDEACLRGKVIHVSYVDNAPYIFKRSGQMKGILLEIFEKGINFCCKDGVQISYNLSTSNILDLRTKQVGFLSISRTSQILSTIHGLPYVSLIESPGIAVVSVKSVPGEDLLMAILDSWPILVFIITTISLSGICIWVLDFHINPKHFPAFFPLGVCEGFWWAAVTMTTVGYGDKVPKSIGGRLFAVVWISAGLVILAMFMGIVTASLTSSGIGQINHLYGLEVYVINGSAEYQFAILQSAYVQAQESYNAVYSSIASGKPKLALVDLYATTQHQEFFSRHQLRVSTVIDEEVSHGLVLPQETQHLHRCLTEYKASYQFQSYTYIQKYLAKHKIPDLSDGTEYFRGSIFGYSIYAMTGVFILILAVGFCWQYYWLKRRGEWKEENEEIDMKELELSTMGSYQYSRTQHIPQVRNTSTANHWPNYMVAQHSTQVQGLIDEYMNYEGNWTRRFESLQAKHRREQVEIFNLDRTDHISTNHSTDHRRANR